jgi:hypothetical protein
LATASLLLVSSAAAGLVAAPPAGAEQAVVWTVTVRDDGFSVQNLNVQKNDALIFQLDANPQHDHVLTWAEGGLSWDFRQGPVRYGNPFRASGLTLHFYDSAEIQGYDPASQFSGTLTINDPAPSSTTTTTVRPPVTTTTAPRPTTTTTAPATTTTTDGAIHPLLVGDPAPTSSTTYAPVPLKVTSTGGQAAPAPAPASGPATVKDKPAKPAPSTTTTTAPPAPPAGLFDASTLTPAAPTPDPSPAAVTDLGNSVDINSALAGILHPDKPSDDGGPWLLLLACGGFAALLMIGGGWAWFHRSSRYFPA